MVLNSTVNVAANTGVWGIGERVTDFFFKDGVYTSLARDAGTPTDNGKPPGSSMYGHHPIYFGKTAQYNYFGVFNLNPDPADFYIKNSATATEVT